MKILMVCLGNICRSPLAHGVMQALIQEKGLPWEVDSAGTGDWHVGHAPDKRSIEVAKKYNIDISTQKAQWFQAELFDRFDKIVVMDRHNYKDVVALAKATNQKSKVSLFLAEGDVPDPYRDDTLFDPVFQMIRERAAELLDQWLLELNKNEQ